MKRYIFAEAWRGYKIATKHGTNTTFGKCLANTHRLAVTLARAGFDFNTAWCNRSM